MAAAAAVALAVAIPGCTRARAGSAALPGRPQTVEAHLREFSAEPAPGQLRAGRVVLRAVNEGTVSHRLLVIPLPADFPPILEHLRGPNRRFVAPLAGLPSITPGQSRSVALDLVPGRYAFVCPLSDAAGQGYAAKGMATEVRVQ